MGEKLTGRKWEPSPQERKAAESYRARFRARKRIEEARARRGMAVNLAGALGTDNPAVLLYVLALRSVSEASRASAEYGAMAKNCLEGRLAPLSFRGERYSRDMTEEASRLYREAEKAAEEVAQLSTEVELLEAALLSRRDNAAVLRFALASKALESLAAQVVHAAHALEDFAPPSSRPRSRATFAHAPPSFFATELRRSDRAKDS